MSGVLANLKSELIEIEAEWGINNSLFLFSKISTLIEYILVSDNPDEIKELYDYSEELLWFKPWIVVWNEEELEIERLRKKYYPEVLEKVKSILGWIHEWIELPEWNNIWEKEKWYAKKIISRTLHKCDEILRENQALFDSLKDKLTSLPNRRWFDEILTRLFQETNDTLWEVPLNVIYVDLDHFKRINDKFWHSVWDEILKAVSNELENIFSENWWYAARHWWEEFICALPWKTAEESIKIANKVLENISKLYFRSEANWYKIDFTASIWVVTYDKGVLYNSPSDMIKFADKVTYCIKRDWRAWIMHINHLMETWHKCKLDNLVNWDEWFINPKWLTENLKTFIPFLFKNQDCILKWNDPDKKWEPIANLSWIDADYRQLAYIILLAFKNNMIWEKSILYPYISALNRFVSDTNIKLEERFSDIHEIMNLNNPMYSEIREEIQKILKS